MLRVHTICVIKMYGGEILFSSILLAIENFSGVAVTTLMQSHRFFFLNVFIGNLWL